MNSMTGYGNAVVEKDGRSMTVEMKSVNHRFLDINIRMPRTLMYLEDPLRQEIGKYVARGHIEVNLSYKNMQEGSKEITVDTGLLNQYAATFEVLENMGYTNNIKISDIIRIPDVLNVSEGEDDKDAVVELMKQAVKEASEALNRTRKTEGEKIGADLENKLVNIGNIAKKIDEISQGNLEDFASRLEKRLEDLLGDTRIDEQRLHQEVAIYADKIAIDEELVRLDTHIKNMRQYMQGTESVGRKLDFFIQELNREINTIGSKSVNADIAKLVVEAKCEIEKLREQMQNIE